MNRNGTAAEEKTALREQAHLCVLENALLRATAAPERGGKFVSLYSKRTSTEWLLPALRPYAEASTQAGFEMWDGGGFDECLPTIAATGSAPDHGEVWRHVWQLVATHDGSLLLRTTAIGGAIEIERRARLEDASLLLDYAIVNRSDRPQSLLYSAHPLLRVEEGDRILLPAEVRSVRVEGSAGGHRGRGDLLAWPQTAGGIHGKDGQTSEDLSVVGPPDGLQADKLFAGPLAAGWCALFRPSLDEALELSFSSEALPYLGLWICRAAWPDAGEAKQYTVALEPTSSSCDSLEEAECAGTAWRLSPGQRREWTLRFRIRSGGELEERDASAGESR